MDTRAGTFSLPETKIARARDFLAPPEFGPGHTRIAIKRLQEPRGEMDHWALRNTSIRPELAVVDRLLAHYGREACPKGDPAEMKQAYVEFWEAIEAMRVNLRTSEDWQTSYSATFHSVLSLEERVAFTGIADSVI